MNSAPEPAHTDSQTGSDKSHVLVRATDLIVGGHCQYPVCSPDGGQLVPSDTVITPELIAELETQDVASVLLDYRDIKSVVRTEVPASVEASGGSNSVTAADAPPSSQSALRDPGKPVPSKQIEQWRASEAPARTLFVWHGQDPYDPIHQQHLVAHFRETETQLNMLRDAVLESDDVCANDCIDLVNGHFDEMTRDADCTLSSALKVECDDIITAHSLQMSVLGMAIGVERGFDYDQTTVIGLAGMVHDWGWMRVPPEIRNLQGPPTPNEFNQIKQHPQHTDEILQRFSDLPEAVSMVSRQVHEKLDGSGYPQGLQGSDIVEMARILHVADEFLTTTNGTAGTAKLNPYATMVKLLNEASTGAIDADVVRALLRTVSIFPVGSHVNLSDGTLAQVVRPNPDHFTQPVVCVIDEVQPQPSEPTIINLMSSELRIVKALAQQTAIAG